MGLLISPLLLLSVATTITVEYDGLDRTGECGIAIAGARDLAAAVDRYRGRYQHIPDAKQGLAALVPEFLEYVPLDPWGHPYVYEPSGPVWADVLSYGPDGRPGGTGTCADVSARFGRIGSHPPGFLHPLLSVVLTGLPLAAALGAGKRRWCASALAGMSAFWGAVLLATVTSSLGTALRTVVLPLVSFATAVACLVGAIALLRRLPHAALLSLVSVVTAYVLLQYLVLA
jgi:general secretion pathway protein G